MQKNKSSLKDKQKKKSSPNKQSGKQRTQEQRENTRTKNSVKQARKVASLLGTRGVAPTDSVQQNHVVDQSNRNTLIRSVPISTRSIQRFAAAFVAGAVRRGWTGSVNVESFPLVDSLAQAITILQERMIEAITGKEVEGTQQPAIWWELQNALMSKRVYFKTGSINFQGSLDGAISLESLSNYDYNSNGDGISYTNVFSTPGPNLINNFPVLEQFVAAYDPERAAEIVNGLWAFLVSQNQFMGLKSLVSLQEYKPVMARDPSAFAVVFPERGAVWEAVGAPRSTVASEVRVPSPVFAKFSGDPTGAEGVTNRSIYQYHPSGGSSAYLANRLQDFRHVKEFHNKAVPIFKYYEFFEIFESLAIWIGLLRDQAANSSNLTNLPAYPLTSLQLAIVLRQTLMSLFSNEYGFDHTFIEAQKEEEPMVPFAVGVNGKQTSGKIRVRLPSFHAENILSTVRNILPLTEDGGYVADRIPILATKYTELSYLNLQYTATVSGPVFAEDPDEVDINIIDARSTLNSSTVFCQLDCTQLAKLVEDHNNWMIAATPFSSRQYDVGVERGVAFLGCNFKTRLQQQAIEPTLVIDKTKTVLKQNSVKKFEIGTKSSKRVRGVNPSSFSSPSVQLLQKQISGTMSFASAAIKYDQILWLPSFTWIPAGMDFEGYKAFVMEPNSIPCGEALLQSLFDVGTEQNLYQINIRRAQMDLKQPFAETSEWDTLTADMIKKGEGGIFGSLASLFGPTIGHIGKAIDDCF